MIPFDTFLQKILNVISVINTKFPAEIILSNDKSVSRDHPPENRFVQITCTDISQIRGIFGLVLFIQKTV